jgi:alkylated DNA repair dioxygenase AlkB
MTESEQQLTFFPSEKIALPDGELLLYRQMAIAETVELLQRLIADIDWRQESISLFGKRHLQPRLSAWYGDPDSNYRYSGLDNTPQAWTTDLQSLREQVEASCGYRFNSVLLNYYRDGLDSMGMHADDEPELGPDPVIASLSLGATRRMRFSHRHGGHAPLNLPLEGGSLLLMTGPTQRNWKHGINKTRRPCGPRVNLTFRRILKTLGGDHSERKHSHLNERLSSGAARPAISGRSR